MNNTTSFSLFFYVNAVMKNKISIFY